MTLQRRLLILLLVAVPVIWAAAVTTSTLRARHEVHELFDTQQIRLAQSVLALVETAAAENGEWPRAAMQPAAAPPRSGKLDDVVARGNLGEAELADLSIAVWSADGRLRLADRAGAELPFHPVSSGFLPVKVNGEPWSVYYLRAPNDAWTVAIGQAAEERDEVLQALLLGQLLPWVLMLPVLLLAMTLAVRHALKPVRALARDLGERGPDDLHIVGTAGLPAELAPLVRAMNRLFARIRRTLEHERRLTADAAHELRTPLAALRAQWEAIRVATDAATREAALRQVGTGIQRLERVVTQLLALSSVEAGSRSIFTTPVDWRRVVQDALSDCLPLVEIAGGDVEVEWPEHAAPLPLAGDEALLALLVRNLVDNSLRYPGRGVKVRLRFTADALIVEDDGPGVAAEALARIGDRFYRPPGQQATGSGLGLSIVRRVAELHGLAMRIANREAPASGLQVTLSRTGS
jgi:two-component system sensor histidine kinase QseC